jgi:hypothetical protein
MISSSNEQMLQCLDGDHEGKREPRAVGELMAAVLARYGISVSAEPEQPRLPRLEHRSTQLDGLLSVG